MRGVRAELRISFISDFKFGEPFGLSSAATALSGETNGRQSGAISFSFETGTVGLAREGSRRRR